MIGGHIEHRVAHACAVPLATQRGRTTRRQHRPPPPAPPVAPLWERHGRRPRLPPRRCPAQAPHREQGTPGAAHGGSNDLIASHASWGAARPPLLFSPPGPGLTATGCCSEALAMTAHSQNR